MKKKRPHPNFIPLKDIQGQIAKLTGVLVSKYAVRKWLRNGDLKVAIPPWDRRGRYVTRNELWRFIRENSGAEEKLPEELRIYSR